MTQIPLVRLQTTSSATPESDLSTKRAAHHALLPSDRVERATSANGMGVPSPHGFGAGIMVGASAEAGVFGGCGATASAGAGIFSDTARSLHAGTFAGAGAFAGAGERSLKTSPTGDSVNVMGAFAGGGVGAFVTNAASAKQLGGIAQTYSLNVGVGPLKLSVGFGASAGTYLGSVSVGPGIGLDTSRYPTQTVTNSW